MGDETVYSTTTSDLIGEVVILLMIGPKIQHIPDKQPFSQGVMSRTIVYYSEDRASIWSYKTWSLSAETGRVQTVRDFSVLLDHLIPCQLA